MMKNKLTILLLCAALLLALAAPALAEEELEIIDTASKAELFSDWDDGAWWAAPMAWCVDRGYFAGTGFGTIEADRYITRAEFMAVIVRYAALTGEGDVSAFDDVAAEDWFYNAVAVGYGNGVTQGLTENSFGPAANITREQTFAMYTRALKMDSSSESVLERFSDQGDISDYARGSVNAIVAGGIVQGYADGTVRPLNPITRAEVAQILYRHGSNVSIDEEAVPLAELPTGLNGGAGGGGDGGDGGSPDPSISGYVYFYPQNGNSVQIIPIRNGAIAVPSNPVYSGFVFAGWYTAAQGGTRYDFNYDQPRDGMRLYAHWNSPAEAAAQQALNELAANGLVTVSIDTDILATIGETEAVCRISYAASNQHNATLRLLDSSGDPLATVNLTPGDSMDQFTLDAAPTAAEYGNYDVRFELTPEGGAASFYEATLYVAYLWNVG